MVTVQNTAPAEAQPSNESLLADRLIRKAREHRTTDRVATSGELAAGLRGLMELLLGEIDYDAQLASTPAVFARALGAAVAHLEDATRRLQ